MTAFLKPAWRVSLLAALAFAAVPVQRLNESGRRAGQPAPVAKALLPALEGLVRDHGAAVALHSGVVCRDKLCGEHSLEFILGSYPD